jgi:acetoin utilization deacetylase AcuC-like enzyme
MRKTAYLYDNCYLDHITGYGHPERPDRVKAINSFISSQEYNKHLIKIKPSICDIDHIEMIHSPDYIKRVKREIEAGTSFLDSMDTGVCAQSFEIACKAVGGCINMCDSVMNGDADNGFCTIRPPGHHAEWDYAAGFCIFNNIAIAARYLQTKHALEKIAIIDWDVHHGNGTQHSFESDNTIYYISLHQFPHYPGTGSSLEKGHGKGLGYTLNLPMEHGCGDNDYLWAFKNQIIPALNDFKPDAVLVSAGFDAHRSDPLSGIALSTESYYEFSILLKAAADEYSKGRIIAFLEGGYNIDVLPLCVDQVIKAFMEE